MECLGGSCRRSDKLLTANNLATRTKLATLAGRGVLDTSVDNSGGNVVAKVAYEVELVNAGRDLGWGGRIGSVVGGGIIFSHGLRRRVK